MLLTAILASVAIPAMGRFVRDIRHSTEHNRFLASLDLARRAAVTSGRPSVMCKTQGRRACTSRGDWGGGWMIFIDRDRDGLCTDADDNGRCDDDSGRIVRVGAPSPLTIKGNGPVRSRVIYAPSGRSLGYMGTFSICDTGGAATQTGLVLIMTGRVRSVGADDPSNVSCPAG